MCAKNTSPLDEWLPALIDRELTALREAFATSLNAIRHTGARYAAVADKRPLTGRGIVAGYALRETSGTDPAVVELRDGPADDLGTLLFPITLAPGESVRDWFGPEGISVLTGLNVTITGAVDGALFLGGRE